MTGRPKRPRRWLGGIALAAIVASLAGGCGEREAPEVRQPIAAWKPRDFSGFVGSAACTECHQEIAERYRSHPMSRAMSLAASDADAIEDFAAGEVGFETSANRRYRVVKRDGKVTHHEIGLDPKTGEVLFDHAEEVTYAIGSGARGRTYVTVEEGRMYESPISWYSSQAKWDLSPGYPPENHPRFNREIGTRCLNCHCGLPAEAIGGTVDFAVYPDPHVVEFGIGCERCHGPGESHIAFQNRRKVETGLAGVDPIVNPIRLDPERRDDTCNQCHLLGEETVLREGRRNEEFRAGDRMGDIWSVFVHGSEVDGAGATKAVSHVQQMNSSRCYVASRGKLGCVSCHDPHGLPSEAEAVGQYRRACLECHGSGSGCSEPETVRLAAQPDDSCVACHMPQLAANDIPHTSQTDHRILRRPAPGETQAMGERSTVDAWEIFGGETLDWTDEERSRALALALAVAAAKSHDVVMAKRAVEALEPLLDRFPRDAELHDLLAYSHYLTGNRGAAFRVWDRLFEIDPKYGKAHRTIATILMSEGSLGPARDHLVFYLDEMPRDVDALLQMSMLESRLLRPEEALRWAERARQLDPGARNVERWYAELTSQ